MDISRRDFLTSAVCMAALFTAFGSRPAIGVTADSSSATSQLVTKSKVFSVTDYSSVDLGHSDPQKLEFKEVVLT